MADHEAHQLLKLIRMDLSQVQARVTELSRMLNEAGLKHTPRPHCKHCGLTFRWESARDEHEYHQHDGPEPKHWIEQERISETGETQAS